MTDCSEGHNSDVYNYDVSEKESTHVQSVGLCYRGLIPLSPGEMFIHLYPRIVSSLTYITSLHLLITVEIDSMNISTVMAVSIYTNST